MTTENKLAAAVLAVLELERAELDMNEPAGRAQVASALAGVLTEFARLLKAEVAPAPVAAPDGVQDDGLPAVLVELRRHTEQLDEMLRLMSADGVLTAAI
jgi:hypothetical protein